MPQFPRESLRPLTYRSQQPTTLPQPITLTPELSPVPAAQHGTALSEKSACAGKKGCALPASPSAATSAADDSPALQSPALASQSKQQELPDAPTAQIPVADLKPLFDYVQDCRSCQAKLAAAKQDSVDNAAKLGAVTKERDAALATAKGGTFWRRLRRNALWFVIGAGAGAAAVCATGHCR